MPLTLPQLERHLFKAADIAAGYSEFLAWSNYFLRQVTEAIGIPQKIKAAEAELGARKSIKAGLMDDLLKGRVRVTPLLALEGTSP
jgi:hypothetical protein